MSNLKKEKFIKNKAKKLYDEWIHSEGTMTCLETIEKAIILGMDNALSEDKPDVYSAVERQHSRIGEGAFYIYKNEDKIMSSVWYGEDGELTRNEAQELAENIVLFLETK